jgi:ELWxxDGT repeat protein
MLFSTELKKTFTTFIIVLPCLFSRPANAQPQLLKDLNNSIEFTHSSNPISPVPFGGSVYFRAYSESSGDELYKSDGTEDGTVLVKDIFPGISNSLSQYITASNDHIFFTASDGISGTELWKSDGTAVGTVLVKDIIAGRLGSVPSDLININGTIYFTAFTSDQGRELWKSDGTEAGTVIVKDIRNGPSDGMAITLANFAAVNDILFFTADDGINGRELWKSDGTEAGTLIVKDLNPGSTSTSFFYLTPINNTLYFTSDGGGFGQELWKSDGTEVGTVPIEDVGTGSSGPGRAFLFKDEIYFPAYDANGFELWKTNGTAAGTIIVKDINPGPESSLSGIVGTWTFVGMGDYFYFAADDGTNYQQLWRSDGTAAGTTMVKKIHPSNHSFPYNLAVVNNTLYFRAAGDGSSPDFNIELWKSDGTEAGTELVKDIRPEVSSSPLYFTASNGTLFFTAEDGIHGTELWRSDGTKEGTFLLRDINKQSSSYPRRLATTSADNLFFVNLPGGKNYEIWKSDGTGEGTVLVKDINPGAVRYFNLNATNADGKFFFTIDDGTHGFELWVSDGTEVGTKLVKDIFPGPSSSDAGITLSSLPYIDGVVFFTADDGINGIELWKSDGTEAGTGMVKNLDLSYHLNSDQCLVIENTFYFFDRFQLFKSDGTEGGTSLIKNINPLNSGTNARTLVNNNNILYFSIDDGIHGLELWKSDGTEAGTVMVKDIYPNSGLHFLSVYGAVNGTVYLAADDGIHGLELWKSDGTDAGTVMVKDISAGPSFSGGPVGFCTIGNTLYFYAHDEEHGEELWKSDGTSQGTMLVEDIYPGPSSSRLGQDYLEGFKGIVYFYAEDVIHGMELWRSDGTPEGTYIVEDINPSQIGSHPLNIVAADNLLYFTANDGAHGREVWKFNPSYIKFDAIPDKIATDGPFAINAIAYSGLPVSFNVVTGPAIVSGSTITLTGSGAVTVRASQPGNEIYNPAEDVERTFNVAKANQTITFEPLEDKNSNDEPFELSASASSGLPVAFSIKSGSASLSNNILSITGPGTVTVKASQAGNAMFAPAPDVEQFFTVNLILSAEYAANFPIKIFPNPSKDIVNVELSRSYVSVALMNNIGQRVWFESKLDEKKFSIHVNDLPKGLYLLHIADKEKNYTQKIIVE